ncbi:signal recognition particle protein [Colletotrichum graminicola]|uniref:Signal recognition particle subunit SRP68 n=1 Tax=Colletotrichum graminicola (strain M1.001 / M2 / FGSC 10212) TaxID=645133 RepID=E3QQQ6_COLGM|nr:signal recognition particle protein [Colletotrichum graminicola M1.001]EFQ33194.1 signal recognition particle protein [Colletotrichum graminicola M1.001]WDK17475.1 signal recognition particle protein [Colletotrichum graminicola]
MDITKFVVSGRDAALLYGDYATYQNQLAKKLLNSRKKLGIATRNRGKFSKKGDVTATQIAENHEYIHLLLLMSERAWANAMAIKSSHASDAKGVTGKTRSHIVSRLEKAAKTAEQLVELLSQSDAGATQNDKLESRAYAAQIRGAAQFEKQHWEPSLKSYAVSRIIYNAMATSTKGDIFKDLLSDTIDPSIRYAAYQLKTPRTIPIPAIASRAFPQSDIALVQQINEIDPNLLKQAQTEVAKEGEGAENAPRTLTWRSREVQIEDAAISLAWGRVEEAKAKLSEQWPSLSNAEPRDMAAAYDDILEATQDAADATKEAIDELRGEGVSQGDSRMQSLQITRTAVNYEMISWRIGRNRVLTGRDDGLAENYSSLRKKSKDGTAKKSKEETPGRKAAKLKELVALYEGTLQSLEAARELPGVANDEDLAEQLESTAQYFQALKSLSIARSHAIIGNTVNALALTKHATSEAQEAASTLAGGAQHNINSPRNIDVSSNDAKALTNFLQGELQRYRALVHLSNLLRNAESSEDDTKNVPLIERLREYPSGGTDLANLVNIPPKLSTIPVKPIFLDVAWNYIDYPGKEPQEVAPPNQDEHASESGTKSQSQKRGWFGFGR